MKTNTDVYNEIVEYIRENRNNITEAELRLILRYIRSIRINNINVDPNITEKSVLEDLKALNENMQKGELTPLSYKRLGKEFQLFERLLSGDSLEDISYELDKLYVDNDMNTRKKSSLIYSLKKHNAMEK